MSFKYKNTLNLTGSLFSIEYTNKKGKRTEIKFVKDEKITRDDVFKDHTVKVASGESPSSLSRPPAKRKPGTVRPISQGKLLRAGDPPVSTMPTHCHST